MEDKFVRGTPPMALLPAKNYIFKVDELYYSISVPKRGNYHDLAPDFFPDAAGEFNIFDEEKGLLYLSTITKVLFATGKYPDLKFNQFFVPSIIKFEDDNVVLMGQVVDMMLAKKSEELEKEEV